MYVVHDEKLWLNKTETVSETVSVNKEIVRQIKLDPYCAVNCKREPITKRILEYIGNIENGFYIEAGAYDGLLQSNTKFLEEEFFKSVLVQGLRKDQLTKKQIQKCSII